MTAIFVPKPGCHDEVVAALRPAIEEVHTEPGCLLYAIHDDPADPDQRIVMIEKWESVELLDQHGSAPAVKKLRASLEGLLAEPIKVSRLVPLPVGDATRGAL